MRRAAAVLALALIAIIASFSFALAQTPAEAPTVTEAPAPPDCHGYATLAKKAYDTERWWQRADPTPATKHEDNRLDAFVKRGCGTKIRAKQKHEYAEFYDKVITPCGDFANCAVASCESSMGTTTGYTYGFTVYWGAIGALPKWITHDKKGHKVVHTRTGARFAPSEPAANEYEDNVFAAAAFKFGPSPGTCAS